jgi:plastocyanin
MNGRARALLVSAAAIGFLVNACTKKEEAAPPLPPPPSVPAPAGAAVAAPAGAAMGAATIKGTVKLTGTPPEMKMLKREADPVCGRKQMAEEDVQIGPGGGLGNVLVRISQGVSGSYPPPAAAAHVDQVDCMYRPRVQGIILGQPLAIGNSDQTLHNVHSYKGPSTLFNQAQIPGMAPMTKKLDQAGEIIKLKCDVHPWMTGYVAVSSHPFFAVTGADGTFTIGKVPAGKYTLEAWHERFGTKTTEITVAENQPVTADFTFESK